MFIDRSLSYHIAFYCTEKDQISKREIVSLFNNRIIDKRIEESIRSGFIEECGVQIYCPTEKGKMFSKLVMAVGSITNTMNEYNKEKKEKNYE